jgi:hypothetical protein
MRLKSGLDNCKFLFVRYLEGSCVLLILYLPENDENTQPVVVQSLKPGISTATIGIGILRTEFLVTFTRKTALPIPPFRIA